MTEAFTFEFYSDIEHLNESLSTEAENRLRKLTKGHTDLTGASVAIKRVAHGETPHGFEARVVAYTRPENIAAVEKETSPDLALKHALTAVERQIREKRDRLSHQ